MLPLYMNDLFGYSAAMAMATLIGLGFGFVLERAGFGRASVLVSQFYGTDNRVFKVMFTGIATATVGLGLMAGLGLMDLGAVTIPETFFAPQLVGGLLLGAGFVISGYCPGTALVAAGSGNKDGWYSIMGTMVGGIAFAIAYPWLETFYLSGSMGRLTLPDLLGLSWPVVATGVVVMASGAFLLAEKGELFFSKRAGVAAPAGTKADRNLAFAAMGGIAAFSLATLALPSAVDAAPAGVAQTQTISTVQLAERIVAAPTTAWIVDLRDPAICAEDRVPGAMCLPSDDPDAKLLATLPPTRDLVLYGQDTLASTPASTAAFRGRVLVLDGGYDAFDRGIMTEPTPPTEATRAAVDAYQHLAALHGALTGSTASAAPVMIKPTAVTRSAKKGGGC